LVNYQEEDAHWKLKAEIGWLKEIVSAYLLNFDQAKLQSFTFENEIVKADIIWAIKAPNPEGEFKKLKLKLKVKS